MRSKHAMLLVACLITFLPVSAAADGAYNVQVTQNYVKATAKCSDGTSGYYYQTATFKNYCPHCHRYGTLTFNPKGTVEGEWTCSACDSDYCAADGKEKISGSSYYLSTYTPPKQVKAAQEVKVVKSQQTAKQTQDSTVQPAAQQTQESTVQPAESSVQPQPVDSKTKMLNILSSFKGKSFLSGL
ncbi:hypothetical protein [Methanobacterium paludis]|nr:hypothetical protein [Methanobacterium paludis]